MGGARGTPVGTPVGFTPQTSGLVQRGGGGISTLLVTSTPPATVPAATPSPIPAAPMPSISPTMPSDGGIYGQTGMVGGGLSSTPAASNKGGGLATTPSPTFASDPVVAQPLPPTQPIFPPIVPQPAPPIAQQSNKGGGRTASPSTGLTSIPLEPYGNPTDTTGTRDVADVTELSRTTFDPALTARDTLDRIELMEKRFADQDAAEAAANAPTAAERQAEEDRKFRETQRRIFAAEAHGGA